MGERALPVEIADIQVLREADLFSRAASWQRNGGDALSRLPQVDLSRRGAAEALVGSLPEVVGKDKSKASLEIGS